MKKVLTASALVLLITNVCYPTTESSGIRVTRPARVPDTRVPRPLPAVEEVVVNNTPLLNAETNSFPIYALAELEIELQPKEEPKHEVSPKMNLAFFFSILLACVAVIIAVALVAKKGLRKRIP